ncbi:MAG TPA: hypothetical protein VKH19_17190 [Gemmatimonadaceae bacterium]|nr:hypothetical protein [Gemmatimonadaceae bacterium]
MTGYFHAGPRALQPGDSEAVRALVWAALGVTPYVDRVTELLTAAERGDPETRALVIERDGTVAALALYGPVAGAAHTWQLSMVLTAPRVDLREVGNAIIEGVTAHARADGARLLVAELPADAALGRTLTLLRANRFSQEGRIADFYRDGVARLFLRRDLDGD